MLFNKYGLKRSFLTSLAVLSLAETTLTSSLFAQTDSYSTSSTSDQTILQNYYDRDTGATTNTSPSYNTSIPAGVPQAVQASQFYPAPPSTPQYSQFYNAPNTVQNVQSFTNMSPYDQAFINSQFARPVPPQQSGPPLGKPLQSTRKSQNNNQSDVKGGKGKQRKLELPKPKISFAVPTYTYPGLVGPSNRRWIGSDYLFFLPDTIGVVIQIFEPAGGTTPLNQPGYQRQIEKIFEAAGVTPQAPTIDDNPPMPFFHLLVMLYRVENRVFASVAGRLFEEAQPARLNMDLRGKFQSITWEYEEIIISSEAQFEEQLKMMIDKIANTFMDRYRYFVDAELDAESPNVLDCSFQFMSN